MGDEEQEDDGEEQEDEDLQVDNDGAAAAAAYKLPSSCNYKSTREQKEGEKERKKGAPRLSKRKRKRKRKGKEKKKKNQRDLLFIHSENHVKIKEMAGISIYIYTVYRYPSVLGRVFSLKIPSGSLVRLFSNRSSQRAAAGSCGRGGGFGGYLTLFFQGV